MSKLLTVQFPLKGEWKAISSPGHHRYAYDFCAIRSGRLYSKDKTIFSHLFNRVCVEEWYSWAQPVYSPVSGIVVDSSDGMQDRLHLNYFKDLFQIIFRRPKINIEDIRPFAGNYVLLQSDSNIVFIAHLKEGSLKVQKGQPVVTGQLIGEIGNSGYSMVPHLHFQIMDGMDLLRSNIIPFSCVNIEVDHGGKWEKRMVPIKKGEMIRSI